MPLGCDPGPQRGGDGPLGSLRCWDPWGAAPCWGAGSPVSPAGDGHTWTCAATIPTKGLRNCNRSSGDRDVLQHKEEEERWKVAKAQEMGDKTHFSSEKNHGETV